MDSSLSDHANLIRNCTRNIRQICRVGGLAVAIFFSNHLQAEPLGPQSTPLWLRYPAVSELYKVSIEEGHEPEMILTTSALNAQYDRAGQRLLYEDKKSYENLWRKHNTSSFAHDIWLFDARSGDHSKLTSYAGEDRNPVWAPDENSFFYLSEQSGSFNIWKLPVNGAEKATPQQVTHLEKNPIRFLSVAQNGDLCFGYDGEIYVLPHEATEPARVKIRIALAGQTPLLPQID